MEQTSELLKVEPEGWVGMTGVDFVDENVGILLYGIGSLISSRGGGRVLVGRDSRFFTHLMWEKAVYLLASFDGVGVSFFGAPVPLPFFLYELRRGSYAGGVYFTGGCLPYTYNGVKAFFSGGRMPTVEEVEEIKRNGSVYPGSFESDMENLLKKLRGGGSVQEVKLSPVVEEYFGELKQFFESRGFDFGEGEVSFAVDTFHFPGAEGIWGRFEELFGIKDLYLINSEPDPTYEGKSTSPHKRSVSEVRGTLEEKGCGFAMLTNPSLSNFVVTDNEGSEIPVRELLCFFLSNDSGETPRVITTGYLTGSVRNYFLGRLGDGNFVEAGNYFYELLRYHYDEPGGSDIVFTPEGDLCLASLVPYNDAFFVAALLVAVMKKTGRTLAQMRIKCRGEMPSYSKWFELSTGGGEVIERIESEETSGEETGVWEGLQKQLFVDGPLKACVAHSEDYSIAVAIKETHFVRGLTVYIEADREEMLAECEREILIRLKKAVEAEKESGG